ncbi:hypothetical protein BCEP27_70221 [Burkholderia cepacia]
MLASQSEAGCSDGFSPGEHRATARLAAGCVGYRRSIREIDGSAQPAVPHDVREIPVVSLCAILSGADSWGAIQVWGESKLD